MKLNPISWFYSLKYVFCRKECVAFMTHLEKLTKGFVYRTDNVCFPCIKKVNGLWIFSKCYILYDRCMIFRCCLLSYQILFLLYTWSIQVFTLEYHYIRKVYFNLWYPRILELCKPKITFQTFWYSVVSTRAKRAITVIYFRK